MIRRPASKRRSRSLVVPTSAWALSDDAVERALLNGSHANELDNLFGESAHDELAGLARQAAASKRRGGPKVLILPGIMGSKLGVKHSVLGLEYDQVYWLDPLEFAFGVAKKVALSDAGDPGSVVALGVFLSAYLKIKFLLTVAGYDAEFYPYDWRINIQHSGEVLKDYVNSFSEKVSLVAHSMGGLVARAAINQKAKVERLVMLGTPNYGSFAPVQAFRGVYSTVKKLAALDLTANAGKLAEIFATFDGLCQMLPASGKFAGLDFYDPSIWPTVGPKIKPKVFQRSAEIQTLLAPADERFFLIAGYNQETVVGARLSDDKSEFEYELSQAGDGTVPLQFARLENTKTYYVEESHGSLPNNSAVIRAVGDLLSQGETQVLSDAPASVRSAAVRRISESELKAIPPYNGQVRGQLRAAQLREITCETAAPLAPRTAAAATPLIEKATSPSGAADELWQSLTVSRIRQHRLEIRLAMGSITDVDARSYILGLFRAVTPSGAAKAIDEQMDGVVTELTQRRMFNSNVGEIFIVPAARSQLRADMVVFAGLVAYDQFDDEVQKIVAENVLRTLLRTHVEDLATVMLGAGSGASISRVLTNMLQGFIRAKLDADGDQHFRRITLCEYDPNRYTELRNEMYRLASTDLFKDVEVSFSELRPRPAPLRVLSTPAEADRRVAPSGKDPLYLLVRQETSDGKTISIRSSLLPTGAKAAILSDLMIVDSAKLDKVLAQIESSSFNFTKLPQFGANWAEMVLPESIRAVLPTFTDDHLVVVHDADSSRLPWETLHLEKGSWTPALIAGISHRYLAANMSVVKFLESRRQDDNLHLLLIVDPTQTLDGAIDERDRMLELRNKYAGLRIDTIEGDKGTRPAILKALSSGNYDVVHYAGHAEFDPVERSRSGILCANDEVLSGADLSRLSNLPNLVFFNACESARVRSKRKGPGKGKKLDISTQKRAGVSFAEAFLRGGVANFVGTYWPVEDAAAKAFGPAFYNSILSGANIGEAVLAGRTKLHKDGKLDWADYIHFGNFQFQVKLRKDDSNRTQQTQENTNGSDRQKTSRRSLAKASR